MVKFNDFSLKKLKTSDFEDRWVPCEVFAEFIVNKWSRSVLCRLLSSIKRPVSLACLLVLNLLMYGYMERGKFALF